MIIVKLQGGLGNQMFQWAAARFLSIKNNTRLKIDTSVYQDNSIKEDFTNRIFELNKFDLPIRLITQSDYDNFFKVPNSKNLINKFKYKFHQYSFYDEKNLEYDSNFINIKNNTYISGYFQSEKYFFSINNQIKCDFQIPKHFNFSNHEFYTRITELQNSVSIHVRRGDYITNKKAVQLLGCLSLNYYIEAINYIKRRIEVPVFFIFSDDIEWCKQNFKQDNISFIDGVNSFESLLLMSKCKHNIIANSSFSWWGAWLNMYKDKIVIAPKQWFNNNTVNSNDLIPVNWLKI